MSERLVHQLDCEKATGRGPFCTCTADPALRVEMTSLREIKQKLDELLLGQRQHTKAMLNTEEFWSSTLDALAESQGKLLAALNERNEGNSIDHGFFIERLADIKKLMEQQGTWAAERTAALAKERQAQHEAVLAKLDSVSECQALNFVQLEKNLKRAQRPSVARKRGKK